MLRNIIFADTSAIYAISNKDDKHHRQAVDFASSLSPNEKLVISNYVFVETWSLLNSHLGWQAALAFYDDVLSKGFHLIDVREIHILAARKIMDKLDKDRLIDREDVLDSLDNRILNLPMIVNYKKVFEDTTKDIIDKEIITRLESLEEKLQQEEEEPPRTRISDSYSIINAVFKIIQEQGPVRKSEVIASCPDAEKSFHHWINILKDKHGVIELEGNVNYKLYSVVSMNILDRKLEAGELVRTDDVFSVVESKTD